MVNSFNESEETTDSEETLTYRVSSEEFESMIDHVSFIRSLEHMVNSVNSSLDSYYNSDGARKNIMDDGGTRDRSLQQSRIGLRKSISKSYLDSSHYMMVMMLGEKSREWIAKVC